MSSPAPAPTPYLVYLPAGADHVVFPADHVTPLDPHLQLVVSTLARSRLYHRIKRQLPPGSALLVVPISEAPKFKGMAAGALAACRDLWPPAP
ncbi:hypothetical protein [Brevundimonas lutea]|uniref:hypothetical protein n=1 Tax=Brevundimonas lutea TaxID=2293980 RepID=UPI000F033609|nr:hypothetical protein [Brevundimonas lutea]